MFKQVLVMVYKWILLKDKYGGCYQSRSRRNNCIPDPVGTVADNSALDVEYLYHKWICN